MPLHSPEYSCAAVVGLSSFSQNDASFKKHRYFPSITLYFSTFYCYYVFIDVRLSHLNKDYLLTYFIKVSTGR